MFRNLPVGVIRRRRTERETTESRFDRLSARSRRVYPGEPEPRLRGGRELFIILTRLRRIDRAGDDYKSRRAQSTAKTGGRTNDNLKSPPPR